MRKKTNLNPIEKAKANPKSRHYAIKGKCFECSGEQYKEVTHCPIPECPLWPLRPWQIKEDTKKGQN